MKKLFVILMFVTVVLAQSIETVTELQMEKELAERIENMLFPVVGKTIVDVDISLQYPSDGLIPYGIELNKDESLPGLPVSKSRGILPNNIDGQPTLPTQITSKKIVIYTDELLELDKEKFIRVNVVNWTHINDADLTIQKTLSLTEIIQEPFNFRPFYLVIALFLLLTLIFIFVFNSKIKKLSEAMRTVNISGFDKAIRIIGNLQNQNANNKSTDILGKGPIPIKIMDKKEEEDNSFNFLESLSINDFLQLVEKKNLAFVLTLLSADFTNNFFVEIKEDSSSIIKEMLSISGKTKDDISKLRNNLFKKYLEFIEKKKFAVDGKDTLIGIINKLPVNKADEMFAKLRKIDKKIAIEIREKIFLFEDILKLKNEMISQIISSVNRNLLVSFLASTDASTKAIFMDNMPNRLQSIIQEDLEVFATLEKTEKERSVNLMFSEIRNILG